MIHYNKEDLINLNKIKRLNLINSISGIKPANLVGSISTEGVTNLAIISSVIHLGSNPALLGFIMRPTGEVRRDTWENIQSIPYYTINHITEPKIKNAHFTSAKFDSNTSEFDTCGFQEEYLAGFAAPFVEESVIKIGMKMIEILPIKINGTIMIIGEVHDLFIPSNSMNEEGQIDLEVVQGVGISGLDTYYSLKKLDSFPFARVENTPDFQNS